MTRLTLGVLLLCSCLIAQPATAATTALATAPTNQAAINTPDTVSYTMQDTVQNNIQDSSASGHDLSPWGMYQAADVGVKSVLIALLLASVLTWAIWLFKTIELNLSCRQAKRLLRQLIDSPSLAHASAKVVQHQGSTLLLVKATQHELQLSAAGPASDEGLKERVVARLDRVQACLIANMNQGTGILASIGSVAPFVGLFGTVWGIMNSFIGIAQTQTTNLAVVAPGIAEALLATAVGLVAAIPAVVIYNYFSRAIGSYRALIADTTTALMVLLSRDLDRHHPDARLLPDLISAEAANPTPLLKDVS